MHRTDVSPTMLCFDSLYLQVIYLQQIYFVPYSYFSCQIGKIALLKTMAWENKKIKGGQMKLLERFFFACSLLYFVFQVVFISMFF